MKMRTVIRNMDRVQSASFIFLFFQKISTNKITLKYLQNFHAFCLAESNKIDII